MSNTINTIDEIKSILPDVLFQEFDECVDICKNEYWFENALKGYLLALTWSSVPTTPKDYFERWISKDAVTVESDTMCDPSEEAEEKLVDYKNIEPSIVGYDMAVESDATCDPSEEAEEPEEKGWE